MTRKLIFLTHAEVDIDPNIPIPDWSLSSKGRARHEDFASSRIVSRVSSLYSSAERKAVEGAAPIAAALKIIPKAAPTLGENDRSATGFLAPEDFEQTADLFFAQPDTSIRGWERARAAQARIVSAVGTLDALDTATGDMMIVAHGAVGALLRCWLKNIEITRDEDQPAGGGCYFVTDTSLTQAPSDWSRI